MDNARVLVVDDDVEIAEAIQKMLIREGHQALVAHDGLSALEVLSEGDVHLVIMDVMMPRLDGLSATMRIRDERNIPIIILSAKSEESDKILGLSMGADDYVSKPFNPGELMARVNSHLRRYMRLGSLNQEVGSKTIFNGRLMLDTSAKQLHVDGEGIHLTAKEYQILELLMMNPGNVFSAERIYERVWKSEAFSVENTVMVHIRRIREKIELNPRKPEYLKVVWGVGYKMEKI